MKAEKSKLNTLSDYQVKTREDVFASGLEFIQDYHTLLTDLRLVVDDRDSTGKKMNLIKSGVFADVSKETKGDKPVYTNEASRTAETERRLALKKEYITLEEKYKAMDDSAKVMKDELYTLDKAISMFKAFLNGG